MLTNHPDVDGIFEMNVPHLVRALIKLGTSCNPASGSGANLSRGLDQGFDLHQLVPQDVPLSKRKYLDAGRSMRYAYLYHSNSDSRHVFCLVLPQGEAKMFIVDKGRNRDLPNMEKYYTDAKAAFDSRRTKETGGKAIPSLFEYPRHLKIDATYHAEPDVVYRAISRELAALQSRKQGPTILALCSAKTRYFYEARIAAMQQYPVIMLPSSQSDNSYPTRLMWQGPAAKRMVQHYLRLALWLKDRIDISHKANVPLYVVHWAVLSKVANRPLPSPYVGAISRLTHRYT